MMKKYLFYDTEKSNDWDGVSKMCEFGYVITDDKFNILKKDVIVMSPGKGRRDRFESLRHFKDKKFNRAYDEEYYLEQPEFPTFYNEIKGLLEDKDTIVFAFSANNDVKAVNNSCRRYGLDYIEFEVYDIQIMYSAAFLSAKDTWKQLSLETVFDALKKPEELRLSSHLSRDDAIMTMKCLQKMTEKLEVSVDDLIHTLCPMSLCVRFEPDGYDGGYYPLKSNRESGDGSSHSHTKTASICQQMWGDYYRSYSNSDGSELKFTVWSSVKEDEGILTNVINKGKESHYHPVDSISGSNVIVCLDENDVDLVKSSLKRPYEGRVLTVKEFLKTSINSIDASI